MARLQVWWASFLEDEIITQKEKLKWSADFAQQTEHESTKWAKLREPIIISWVCSVIVMP